MTENGPSGIERRDTSPEDRRRRFRREEDLVDRVLDDLEQAKKKLKRQLKSDFARIVGGFLLMCLLFLPELKENLIIFKYVTGFLVGVAIITHFTRRILFPYINLKDFSNKSLENPIAASIVFFGICLIVAVTITASASFFSR